MRALGILRVLAVCLLAICLSESIGRRASANELRPAEDRLFDLMRAEGLTQHEVEARFFEVFSYHSDGVEVVRPFRFDPEFFGYSVSDQSAESIEKFKAVAIEFSELIGVEVGFTEIEVADLEGLARENPRRNYIMFEPLASFPTLFTWRKRIIREQFTNYIPRDVYGTLLGVFPYEEIRYIQEGKEAYRHTCYRSAFQQNGFLVHSFAFLDSTMPEQIQYRCMWLIVTAAIGFRDPMGWGADTGFEYLERGPVGLTPIDTAAILLSQTLALKAGTLRTKVTEEISKIWQGDT